MKKLYVFLFTLCFFQVAFGQSDYRLNDYVVSHVGDEYQYKNLSKDGKSPIVVGVSETVEFRGTSTHKRFENNGDYRLQTSDEKGLTIYWLYFIGNRVIEYEKPVVQMPAILTVGKTYRTTVKYKYFDKNELKNEGIQTYEVETSGLEDIVIKGKTIKNCLVIVTRALRTDTSGSQKGYELKEWYAKEVGPVKVSGPIYWNGSKGNRIRTFSVDAELEKASINGKVLKY